MDRVILHCDLNSFYASVELLDHPELRDRPVAVCGDPNSRHGIILAKNEPAKRYKVQTAETIWQARRKCPELVLLPAHHWKYRDYSRRVNALYERYTDLVEPFSIDESWLDITGSLHLFGGDAKALADEIRRVLREELGLTVSVGVSFNKIFAKMGSDYKKPDATTVISRENYQELLWPLPITSLLFVGRSAAAALEHYGVHTIGDLARLDREAAASILGRQGCTLHDYATGAEHSPVVPAREQPGPKSVGNGLTFPRNLVGWAELHAGVTELADEVAVRLRGHGLKCTTLQVTIRDPNFKDICRQKRLSAPTYVARELTETAMELIRAAWRENAPVRALTLTAQALVEEGEAGEPPDLFAARPPPVVEQRGEVERAVGAHLSHLVEAFELPRRFIGEARRQVVRVHVAGSRLDQRLGLARVQIGVQAQSERECGSRQRHEEQQAGKRAFPAFDPCRHQRADECHDDRPLTRKAKTARHSPGLRAL